MESTKVFSGASQKASNGLVQQAVSSNTSAIGYVSLAFTKGTNPVPYNGVPCTLQNAKSGQYSGVRSFYLVSRGAPTKAAQKWINWIRKNSKAQKIIASECASLLASTRRVAGTPCRPPEDRRVGLTLGALSSLVLLLIAGMIFFVPEKALPRTTGVLWFGAEGEVDAQLTEIFNSRPIRTTTSTRSAPGR